MEHKKLMLATALAFAAKLSEEQRTTLSNELKAIDDRDPLKKDRQVVANHATRKALEAFRNPYRMPHQGRKELLKAWRKSGKNYFPIVILLADTNTQLFCKAESDVPIGKGFRVLQTNAPHPSSLLAVAQRIIPYNPS